MQTCCKWPKRKKGVTGDSRPFLVSGTGIGCGLWCSSFSGLCFIAWPPLTGVVFGLVAILRMVIAGAFSLQVRHADRPEPLRAQPTRGPGLRSLRRAPRALRDLLGAGPKNGRVERPAVRVLLLAKKVDRLFMFCFLCFCVCSLMLLGPPLAIHVTCTCLYFRKHRPHSGPFWNNERGFAAVNLLIVCLIVICTLYLFVCFIIFPCVFFLKLVLSLSSFCIYSCLHFVLNYCVIFLCFLLDSFDCVVISFFIQTSVFAIYSLSFRS